MKMLFAHLVSLLSPRPTGKRPPPLSDDEARKASVEVGTSRLLLLDEARNAPVEVGTSRLLPLLAAHQPL
jgi:hypothetical protein